MLIEIEAAPFVPIVREATVEAKRLVAPDVVELTLRFDGDALPPMPAGTHVDLHLSAGTVRQYSVCGAASPHTIRIAVLKLSGGRGGSRFVHDELEVGATVLVGRPRNDFALPDAPQYVLIAGGIGITAILAMARELAAQGKPWRAHYCGVTRCTMAFVDELLALGGPVELHVSSEGTRLDARRLMQSLAPGTAVAVCGPARMADEFAQLFDEFPHVDGFMERFHGVSTVSGADTSFEVVLADSGLQTTVRSDQTVLDAIESLGVFVPTACLQGTCGSCATRVLGGAPQHRDVVLTDAERDDQICVCVSRCTSRRLVLEL